MHRHLLLAPLALVLAAAPAAAQQVGDFLPTLTLSDPVGVSAESFDDLLGNAVLIEFFAHW